MKKPKAIANTAPIRSTPPEAVPEWVTSTPEEISYILEITEWATGDNTILESICLTRAEYIALKYQLAALRGIEIPPVAHEDARACGDERMFSVPEVSNAA